MGFMRRARRSHRRIACIIVEGYFDVIALWQAGFRETVASCGTALTVEQLRLLSRYTKNVFACFDGDDAGRKASLRALEIFLQAGLLGRGIFIPSGFDPDTLVRERGAAFLEELIGASELLVDYFLKEQAREAKGSLEGRARGAEKVADLLKLVANPFEFDLLARKAAELLGVGEDTLRKAARGISRTMRGERRIEMVKAPRAPRCSRRSASSAWSRSRCCIPRCAREIRELLPSELFSDVALGPIFQEACALGEVAARLRRIYRRATDPKSSRAASPSSRSGRWWTIRRTRKNLRMTTFWL